MATGDYRWEVRWRGIRPSLRAPCARIRRGSCTGDGGRGRSTSLSYPLLPHACGGAEERRDGPSRDGSVRSGKSGGAPLESHRQRRRGATDRCVVANRFEVDPWRRVGGEQDLQTAACGGCDSAVGLSFETHHGEAAWRLRRSSRRARRAPAARKSWCCCSCSAASSWCAMTGRAITTAVASQRHNQQKLLPQLKLDGDFMY
uniref:Uncharacterized protein n=1 Tax=Oryza meridionalis TaxID=40149 RepID=A0A0E0E3G0_9ORYZ